MKLYLTKQQQRSLSNTFAAAIEYSAAAKKKGDFPLGRWRCEGRRTELCGHLAASPLLKPAGEAVSHHTYFVMLYNPGKAAGQNISINGGAVKEEQLNIAIFVSAALLFIHPSNVGKADM